MSASHKKLEVLEDKDSSQQNSAKFFKPSIESKALDEEISETKITNKVKLFKAIINEIYLAEHTSWLSLKDAFKAMPTFKKLYNETESLQLALIKHEKNHQITKSSLYDTIIEHWFEASLSKRMGSETMPSDGHSPMHDYFEFAGVLATEMHSTKPQNSNDSNDYLKSINKNNFKMWQELFEDNSNPDLLDARNACPLIKIGADYEFIHPILINYFYTRYVAKVEYKSPDFAADFTPRRLS